MLIDCQITLSQLREVISHFFTQDCGAMTMHERNVICSKKRLNGNTHKQTIICRQLFAGLSGNEKEQEKIINDNPPLEWQLTAYKYM